MDDAVATKEACGECINGEYTGAYYKEECINGEMIRMPAPPNHKHGNINENICVAIHNALKGKKCRVYMENLSLACYPLNKDKITFDKTGMEVKTDYIEPDVMITCDEKLIKGWKYYGVPKFVSETLSPSTAKRDKTTKMRMYEKLGVSEYWIVSPKGSLEVYYLLDGKYELKDSFELCSDTEDEDYNSDVIVRLREFREITMTLGSIFE